jgi:hypothetical protein
MPEPPGDVSHEEEDHGDESDEPDLDERSTPISGRRGSRS